MADLNDEFENEVDLADAFESEVEYTPPTIAEKVADRSQQEIQSLVDAGVEAGNSGFAQGLVETAVDLPRGIAKGLTLGSLDEIGGALSAGAEALYDRFNPTNVALREQGFNLPETSASDLYRQNQQSIQNELEMSAERSPVVDIAGQIAGGVASGSILGSALGLGTTAQASRPLLDIAKNQGKIKAGIELLKRGGTTYAKALPAIAAESALSSKEGGVLTEEERSKLGEDVVGGALFGLPAVLGLQAVTDVALPGAQKVKAAISKKGAELVEDSPLLRQMKVSYDYGERGINPRATSTQLATDLGIENLAELDNSRVKKLQKEIFKADEEIGKAVGKSLFDATTSGKVVNLSQDSMKSLSQLQSIAQKYPELADSTRANDIFNKIVTNRGNITPIEAKDLIDYTDAYINRFKSATNKTPLDEAVLSNLIRTRKDFSTTLKNAIPEYAKAAERMASFRTLVPETIIARSRPVEINNKFFGNLKDQDAKVFDSLKAVVQGTTKSGQAASETRTAFVNMIKGMKEFESGEAARLASGEITESALKRPVSAIEAQIKKFSDDAVARGSMDAITPQTGVSGIAKEAVLGAGAETGRAMALTAANKAGLINRAITSGVQKNSVAKLGRGIYNAPDELVGEIATKLESTPGLEKYGKTLTEAINSGSNNRRNQAIFTIMQNPAARAVVGTDEEQEN